MIIDFEDHSRGGHFGNYLRNFCAQFSKRFNHLVCCTPNPENTRSLFTAVNQPLPENIAFIPLPKNPRRYVICGPRKKSTIETVFKRVGRMFPGRQKAGFVMWGYDLMQNRLDSNTTSGPWGTFADISWTERGFNNKAAEADRSLKKMLESRPDCAVILCWDWFLCQEQSTKRVWIPSTEFLGVPDKLPLEAEDLARLAAGRPIISGLGILSGIRCVDEMLRLTRKHPGVFFLLAGRLYRDSVNPELAPMLDSNKPENLMVMPEFLQEPVLNSLVRASDGLFVDGLNYPVHSSVACKGLHFGKFLVSRESNSWMCDTIRKFDVGVIYAEKGEPDFVGAFRQWKTTGGPERAIRAANELMSEESLNACFDRMTSILSDAAKS